MAKHQRDESLFTMLLEVPVSACQEVRLGRHSVSATAINKRGKGSRFQLQGYSAHMGWSDGFLTTRGFSGTTVHGPRHKAQHPTPNAQRAYCMAQSDTDNGHTPVLSCGLHATNRPLYLDGVETSKALDHICYKPFERRSIAVWSRVPQATRAYAFRGRHERL
ncbi:hypothetical protein K493DRAFT_308113 [Basidiobolus meristosporus CBS 931.73]|uniref:Uncharacterized protein n=1 Tax=Basidiobolus meristosporus CBS 931.73 TaxID=1314790 RepID=A0A1Y1X7G3_9FUNG|nr:hypothetical protein K493DRAFT_308113 [Basidiobolus meristosporus CBS 931.73]|eukprot:ORX81316.1 hypothetical protein K493DRAFT_308113 [Basidiobolus meristosporus CBS 931.73]